MGRRAPDSRVLLTVGFADADKQTPMKPDTLFRIASMTKIVTAVGVMILAEEGKLSVDDPVEKHLPEFHGQKLVEKRVGNAVTLVDSPRPITIKDLLTHTSGMPCSPPPGFAELYRDKNRSLAEGRGGVLAATARDGAGGEMEILQHRLRHHRPGGRGGGRQTLRGVPGTAAVPAAGHEGHHIPADQPAARAAGDPVRESRRRRRGPHRARPRTRACRGRPRATASSIPAPAVGCTRPRWTTPSCCRCCWTGAVPRDAAGVLAPACCAPRRWPTWPACTLPTVKRSVSAPAWAWGWGSRWS